MSRTYFGTDGVRGIYGGPVINEAFATRLGFAAGSWLPRKGRVVVGRDTRSSGASLEAAVMHGLRAAGAERDEGVRQVVQEEGLKQAADEEDRKRGDQDSHCCP